MSKALEKLTALFVRRADQPGWYGDGGNLWLQIMPNGSKSWIFRYTLNKKQNVIGLGPTHAVSLSEAREKARLMRGQLIEGIDPGSERRRVKHERSNTITFEKACADYIETKKGEWTDKHAAQWKTTLETYTSPISKLSVADLTIADILKCLNPTWATKTETTQRVRQRIERVIGWSITSGYRKAENPAIWKGKLENLLASPTKIQEKTNHPSLPWAQAPAFMSTLRNEEGTGARAMELLILTATRSGEIRLATWEEFDLKNKTWRIPAERMKAGKEHTIPLCKQSIELLENLPRFADTNLVFPSIQQKKTMSDMTLSALLRRMNEVPTWLDESGRKVVPHGFRSTFRIWAAEATEFPRELAEHALAHQLPDKVEAAYQRSTLVDKRAEMMQAWGNYLHGTK